VLSRLGLAPYCIERERRLRPPSNVRWVLNAERRSALATSDEISQRLLESPLDQAEPAANVEEHDKGRSGQRLVGFEADDQLAGRVDIAGVERHGNRADGGGEDTLEPVAPTELEHLADVSLGGGEIAALQLDKRAQIEEPNDCDDVPCVPCRTERGLDGSSGAIDLTGKQEGPQRGAETEIAFRDEPTACEGLPGQRDGAYTVASHAHLMISQQSQQAIAANPADEPVRLHTVKPISGQRVEPFVAAARSDQLREELLLPQRIDVAHLRECIPNDLDRLCDPPVGREGTAALENKRRSPHGIAAQRQRICVMLGRPRRAD
jgi:hypothetical protein